MQGWHVLGGLALLTFSWVTPSCTFDRSGVPNGLQADASPETRADARVSVSFDAGILVDPPIGQWTFNSGEELVDIRGNFPDLVLNGDAEVGNGQLDVNGSGSDASGWAVTGASAGLYQGPEIVDKSLVAWLTLEQLQSGGGVHSGSAITLDRESSDHFDGVIFGEREEDRWMSGSSNFHRTSDFVPGFQETTTHSPFLLVVTYDDEDDMPGGDMEITAYRNGMELGSYVSNTASSWPSGDAEVFFGKRHGTKSGGPGALDALINEARVYDFVLSAPQMDALRPH